MDGAKSNAEASGVITDATICRMPTNCSQPSIAGVSKSEGSPPHPTVNPEGEGNHCSSKCLPPSIYNFVADNTSLC